MSCRAILHGNGEESIPLLLVRSGELTPRQCDHEFAGLTGDCPTCQASIDNADLSDGGSYAAAMLTLKSRGVDVSYRKFAYGANGSVEPWRVCYWAHPPGYWDGVEFKDCQNPSSNAHSVHLNVIKRWYEESFKPEQGFKVTVEPRLRRPGDPPRPYSPDLAIYGPKGERLVAVEYQRSHESYEKFCSRDDLRRSEKWADVDWWFDDTQNDPEKNRITVYEKSQQHRTHLALLSVFFYRCWVDPQTLKLEAEYGRSGELPPHRVKRLHRHIEKADLAECSTAAIIRQIESGPERKIIEAYTKPLEAVPGSVLNFKKRTDWSLAKQQKIAEAVVMRQKRLEEQDRRHRKLEAEQKRLFEEQQEQERIQREKQEEESRISGKELAQELRERALEESKKAEEQRIQREKKEKAIKDLEDHKRKLYEQEQSRWHQIQFTEPISNRGGAFSSAVNLRIGSLIRRGPGHEVEVYEGMTNAGYSTDKHTYLSLSGWQVRE